MAETSGCVCNNGSFISHSGLCIPGLISQCIVTGRKDSHLSQQLTPGIDMCLCSCLGIIGIPSLLFCAFSQEDFMSVHLSIQISVGFSRLC